jgi:type VI secretion system protein ImpM
MPGWTGFFGKMPATGDFVSRGLPPAVRPALDRWLSAYLAGVQPEDWPEEGLRARLTLAFQPAVLALVPSGDRLGRIYPLAGLADGTDVTRAGADAWSEAVIYDLADASEGLIGPGELMVRLAAAPPPGTGTEALSDGVWRAGGAPTGTSPGELAALLSSG